MRYHTDLCEQTFAVDIGPDGDVKIGNTPYIVDLRSIDGKALYSVLLNDRSYEVTVEPGEGGLYNIFIEGELYAVTVLDELHKRLQRIESVAHGPTGEIPVKAPMPGLVVAVPVEAGTVVKSGQPVVILEAMKMENEIRAPRAGMVKTIKVTKGQAVNKDEALIILE